MNTVCNGGKNAKIPRLKSQQSAFLIIIKQTFTLDFEVKSFKKTTKSKASYS